MASEYPEVKDLDTLFGFSAARERAAQVATSEDKNVYDEPSFLPHRVFLNHVDTFNGKHIASFLADRFYGGVPGGGGEDGEKGEEGGEEEAEKVMEGEEMEATPMNKLPLVKYEIIGTLQKSFHKKTEDILFTINEDTEAFMINIWKCGYIVYDITKDPEEIPKALATLKETSKFIVTTSTAMDERVEALKELGPKTFKGIHEVRIFILLSTAMTWALTKPIDPEDPSLPFTEADYKKRKTHPNYKAQIDCEKEVVMIGRKNKEKFKTYVIASGIVYGEEEDDLAFLFKLAWNNEKELPVFQPGKNTIPLIHIKDLAKILYGLMEKTPNKPQYILAIEQTQSKLKFIIKALTKIMGSGKTKSVAEEEAYLYKDMTQHLYDRYTVNLIMEPAFIVEGLQIEWQNELNLTENMSSIVNEFRKTRELKPVKIILHGPPAVGKTRIAKQLVEYYGAHYMNVKLLIEEYIQNLQETIDTFKAKAKEREDREKAAEEGVEAEDENVEEEQEEEEETNIEDLEEQLKDIQIAIAESENGKLSDEQVIEMMKSFLGSNRCKNQGYILDGFPKTMAQTRALFGGGGEGGEEEELGEDEGGGEGSGGSSILPDYLVSLQATDRFLYNRVMTLPERQIQGTHYTEENMLRRVQEFRANNTEDNTFLNYFDEMEIHPVVLDVMEDKTENVETIMEILKERIGKPIKFELTAQEEEELLRLQLERAKMLELEAEMKKQLLEQEAVETHHSKMEEWTALLEQLQMEEEKVLVAQSEPLRHYMIKFIFPTLSRGLLEVARLKPDDPVDFLAEYLFKENPEGHMFDPAYTRDGKLILDKYKDNVANIIKTHTPKD